MSVDALKWAFRIKGLAGQPVLSAGAKAVIVTLADRADDRWSCFPSVGDIARRTNQGESTVRRHLDQLVLEGWLDRDRRRYADGQLAQYDFQLRQPEGAILHPSEDKPPLKSSTGPAPKSSGGPALISSKSHRSNRADKNPHGEPSGDSKESPVRAISDFEAFWSLWPKGRKVGKPKALEAHTRAIKRADGFDPAGTILAGLRAHLPAWEQIPLRLMPHPTTWLNRDGWNDDPPPPEGGTLERRPHQSPRERRADDVAANYAAALDGARLAADGGG